METSSPRIEQHGDLFEGVLTEKQSLGKALAAVRYDLGPASLCRRAGCSG